MNLSRYLEICKEIEEAEHTTENKKRESYTAGSDDVLHNFNDDAEFVGTNPLQNVLTHLMKQIRAISSYVKHPEITPSESLLSRVVDVRVYCKLLVAVATELGRDTGIKKVLLDNPLFTHTIAGDCCNQFDIIRGSFTGKSTNKYTPLHKDEILLATQAFDYNFGKDDV